MIVLSNYKLMSEIVPINSKYVPGGFKGRSNDMSEDKIQDLIKETDEQEKYVMYKGPIIITNHEGDMIPIPSSNRGRYAIEDQSAEKIDGSDGQERSDEAAEGGSGGAIISQRNKKKETVEINLFRITGQNRDGIIRRGMHIRYVRNGPRRFVKGGFVRHINSTYIAFRYRTGSSTIQLSDIDKLYVNDVFAHRRKKQSGGGNGDDAIIKAPNFKVVINQDDTESQFPLNLEDGTLNARELADLPTGLAHAYMPPGQRSQAFKKLVIKPRTKPKPDIRKREPSTCIEPITGKSFRDIHHMRQFTSSAKFKRILIDRELPYDPRICCDQCGRRFRDPHHLKRHKDTIKYQNDNCL